jgi:hypothetical protein
MKAQPITLEQIAGASTKDLQALYKRMLGKPTTNRNAKALRAMLTAKLASKPPAAPKRKVAPAKPAKQDKPSKPAPKPVRVVYLPGEKPLPKVKLAPRPSSNNTRAELAKLPAGLVLYHEFRADSPQALAHGTRIEVKILSISAADGTGGRYEYKPAKGDKEVIQGLRGLRALVLRTAGCAVNLLMFWRRADTDKQLAPWPKHAKKQRDGLTEAQKDYVRKATRADLEREQVSKGKQQAK